MIFDELHRTGAERWEKSLDKLIENQPEETKVLGITATPTRDADDRNMSDEVARKLGYTDEDISAGKHIATKIELKEAIQLGMVVNPKVVSCEYNLLTDGSMENLAEQNDVMIYVYDTTDSTVRPVYSTDKSFMKIMI